MTNTYCVYTGIGHHSSVSVC